MSHVPWIIQSLYTRYSSPHSKYNSKKIPQRYRRCVNIGHTCNGVSRNIAPTRHAERRVPAQKQKKTKNEKTTPRSDSRTVQPRTQHTTLLFPCIVGMQREPGSPRRRCDERAPGVPIPATVAGGGAPGVDSFRVSPGPATSTVAHAGSVPWARGRASGRYCR